VIEALPESSFFNPALVSVVTGTALLGLASGALGSIAVFRRNSLLGDALSHAAFPGLLAGFCLWGTKSIPAMVGGAALSAALAQFLVFFLSRGGRVRPDAALALVMGVFFGVGMVIQSHLQQDPGSAQAGLKDYLFGQATLLLEEDLPVLATLAGLVLGALLLCWNRWKIVAFDPAHAASLGINTSFWEVFYAFLLILSVVIGLQVAGVVLMSAFLVIPGSSARYWTKRLGLAVFLSGATGATLGVVGSFTADALSLPPGPTIVVLGFCWLVASFGLTELWKHRKARTELAGAPSIETQPIGSQSMGIQSMGILSMGGEP
jgi:manganese/zinc/iron transport system permease protein